MLNKIGQNFVYTHNQFHPTWCRWDSQEWCVSIASIALACNKQIIILDIEIVGK